MLSYEAIYIKPETKIASFLNKHVLTFNYLHFFRLVFCPICFFKSEKTEITRSNPLYVTIHCLPQWLSHVISLFRFWRFEFLTVCCGSKISHLLGVDFHVISLFRLEVWISNTYYFKKYKMKKKARIPVKWC